MLRKAVENDLIALTNYHSVNQKSASYDLTLAPNVKMLSPRNGSEVDLVDCDFTMEHGDCVTAVTKETISLPPSYIARVGSTAELARQGILVNTGLQIDPGYSGPMRFSIINMSGRPFALFTGQVVMSIEIFYLPVPPDKPFTKRPQGADLIGDLQNSIMSLFDVKKRPNGTSLVSLPRTGFEIRSEHVKRDDAVVEACSILARKLSSAAENSPLMAELSEIASDFTPSFDEVHGSLQSPCLLSLIQQAGVQMSELNLESLEERHETLRGILEQIEIPLNLFFAGVLSSGDLLE
jgi:deoxycytidine triphosphate deaminase